MKLGIVGSGIIVKDFLSITPSLEEIELEAICTTQKSEAIGKELAKQYSIRGQYTDYQEFLSCDVDTVYVALTNHLHYRFAKEALEAGKHVIMEKPLVSTVQEAIELSKIARDKRLFLLEAVTTLYLPNYREVKKLLPSLGNIKIVHCNFSQYSSRYESFHNGMVLSAFDPECSGGALMDLNVYNIHYLVGLFGRPVNIEYYPNIERGIDTSGILILNYNTFQCSCIAAKDCKAPALISIQGDKGCIQQAAPANFCTDFKIISNDGTSSVINKNYYEHRMISEFKEFYAMITNNNLELCYQFLDQSLIVSEILTAARKKGGIVFPADGRE